MQIISLVVWDLWSPCTVSVPECVCAGKGEAYGVCPLHLLSSPAYCKRLLEAQLPMEQCQSPPFTLRAVCCVITVRPAFVQPLIWRLHCGAHVPDPRAGGQSYPTPVPLTPHPTPSSFHTRVQKCADLQSPEKDTISKLTASVRRNRENLSTMGSTSIRHF